MVPPELSGQRVGRARPLLLGPDDRTYFEAESGLGLGSVGGFVGVGTVDLAENEHVDVVRRRS